MERIFVKQLLEKSKTFIIDYKYTFYKFYKYTFYKFYKFIKPYGKINYM